MKARAGFSAIAVVAAWLSLAAAPAPAQSMKGARLLDGFDDASAWKVVTSNQVTASLRVVDAPGGKALCLDYDYHGVSGYAGIQRKVDIEYPQNYRFDVRLRGDSPANDLQFKLADASGDNVWWVNRPRYPFPPQWSDVAFKARHIDKAWGPDPDRTLRRSATLEFTLYNNAGGKGSVCFDALTFTPLPPQDLSPLRARATATGTRDGSAAANVLDGRDDTAWRASARAVQVPELRLDLGRRREFGGLRLRWAPGEHALDYRVQLSDDARTWRDGATVTEGNGGSDWIALREAEARYLRVQPERGAGSVFGLVDAEVLPLKFGDTPNDTVRAIAATLPRGRYPRGFHGEQPYWTLVGVDGGQDQGLIGEDGAIEVGKGAFSLEPFVLSEGELVTWADVQAAQSLQDGYLPIPSVHWSHPRFALDTTAFAQGTREKSQLYGRYRLTNHTRQARRYVLALALRPLQVNPPTQFLSTTGGVSRIAVLHGDTARLQAGDGAQTKAVQAAAAADALLLSSFDSGDVAERLAALAPGVCAMCDAPALQQQLGESARLDPAHPDRAGLASAAWLYEVHLEPGQSREFGWVTALSGPPPAAPSVADLATAQDAVAHTWRGKLDQVRIQVPAAGQRLVDTLRTATAHMLISRVGPRLQPGTRSYGRSWIRDGAMISEGLLRMGRHEVVRDYVDWYAPYQFDNGMVPCCVDNRGSDPVPENDSHGELIFNIAEYWRYTGDTQFLQRMWPHVQGAYDYMETLRLSERTEANRALDPAFYGMMPVSISHEGYSAKPMHSYWDNFWALRGYKDAVEIAQALGHAQQAQRMAASRDQFRDDLDASLRAAVRRHGIDYLPGAAELGDFDATSTTIALAPGGEQGRLPQDLLEQTFQRYWTQFVERRDGRRAWKDYTPYEWRNVAAFVRLGWRERAGEVVDFFFKDRAPPAWNQWAEVVSRTPRTPFFVGDLPHAWVGSDFVRSALDMFGYRREVDDSLVLAAGVPAAWLEGEGIALHGMRTPHGALGYVLRRRDGELQLDVPAGLQLPKGGLVLPWPYASVPGRTTVNGRPATWNGHELRVTALPAQVKVAAP